MGVTIARGGSGGMDVGRCPNDPTPPRMCTFPFPFPFLLLLPSRVDIVDGPEGASKNNVSPVLDVVKFDTGLGGTPKLERVPTERNGEPERVLVVAVVGSALPGECVRFASMRWNQLSLLSLTFRPCNPWPRLECQLDGVVAVASVAFPGCNKTVGPLLSFILNRCAISSVARSSSSLPGVSACEPIVRIEFRNEFCVDKVVSFPYPRAGGGRNGVPVPPCIRSPISDGP